MRGVYTQEVPGLNMYSPNAELGTRQSPGFGGLGTAEAGTGAVGGILETAQNLVINNPLPTLALIAYLAFMR